ncbi:MAG: hypothetical protein ACRDSP_17865 [Pseudonocardiaceae bacterium]
MGELLGQPVDPEYVGRLERGVLTWPHGYHREALRAYFGVASDEELGFYCRRSAPAPAWEDEMRRRALLAALPIAGLATSGTLGALVEAAAAEAVPIPRRVGADQVVQVRALTVHVDEMTHRFGGAGMREMLSAQVRWAVSLLDAHVDPAASSELHSAVGELAAYAGWSSHDAGADTAAHRYYQVALHCADRAGDWSLRAEALSDLSRIAEYSGDAETALTLAQQVRVRSDRLTPLSRACGGAAEARAQGRRGDVEACLAAIGRTEDHVAAADPAAESTRMAAFYSPAQLASDRGHALWPFAMRGHAVDVSAQQLRTAANTYPPGHVRSRTYCLARLATLQLTHGDPHEAVTVANSCLDEARAVQSRRITSDLTSLRHATTKHRTLAAVADLRHRLNHTLASV